jgi:hypothetical protein
MCNTTLRHDRATIVAEKSNRCSIFWGRVCSLRYIARNAHATYCRLWPVRLYIFPHYLKNCKIFGGKKATGHKLVFWFSQQLLSETLFILRRTARDMNIRKCTLVFTLSTHYSCRILIELEIFSTDFRRRLKYKAWKCVQRQVSCSMRADRQADMTKLAVAFRNFENAPKNCKWRAYHVQQTL